MRVAAIQLDVSWEAPKTNLLSASTMAGLADIPAGTLLVLPEMFATGFSTNVETTLAAREATEQALCELALSLGVYLCAGLVGRDAAGQAQNQAVLYAPDGIEIGRYAKRHLFTPLGEEKTYAPGLDAQVFDVGEFRVAPAICYDLRFPEDFRQAMRRGAELFLVLANWPSARQEHWRTLLCARAIENQAYVVGVNRCGADPNAQYAGGSLVVSPRGAILAQAGAGPQMIAAELSAEELRTYREEFPALREAKP